MSGYNTYIYNKQTKQPFKIPFLLEIEGLDLPKFYERLNES